MNHSQAADIRLVGFDRGGPRFWHCERRGAAVDVWHGPLGGDGKHERRAFDDEDSLQRFLSRQVTSRVERGYHVELPFELRRWQDVRADVEKWLPCGSENDDDRVLVLRGDATIPHGLWLDYRRGMLGLEDEADPPIVGMIIHGSLTIEGCLYNYDDDYGPFLLVTGDLKARSIATGGARLCALGAIDAEVVIGVYNQGNVEAKGPVKAKVIASEHPVVGKSVDALCYGSWGRHVVPVRANVADESEPYEPRGVFIPALMRGREVDLCKARDLAIAGKVLVREPAVSLRASFRRMLGRKLADPDKVRHLTLTGKDLTFLPEEIFAFRKLEKLTLTHNKLRRLPEELGQLTELRELHLRGNGLQELPESIGELKHLRVLDLESNCIWRLPDSLARCTELRTIRLTNNPYSYVRASFGGWSKVKLMWELPEVLTRLPNLEELVFSGTFLRKLPSRRFDSRVLRKVIIESSLVTARDPAIHDQIAVKLEDSARRAVSYIRYWFDSEELHLEDFYSARRDTYDFTEIRALLLLLLQINIPTAAPYTEALTEFARQIPDVIRGLAWGGQNTRHIRALFRALGETVDDAERLYPGNALLAGLRPLFSRHAGLAAA